MSRKVGHWESQLRLLAEEIRTLAEEIERTIPYANRPSPHERAAPDPAQVWEECYWKHDFFFPAKMMAELQTAYASVQKLLEWQDEPTAPPQLSLPKVKKYT